MRDAHMYTPLSFAFSFRQYSCGRECYDMRFTRVKCGDEQCALDRWGQRRPYSFYSFFEAACERVPQPEMDKSSFNTVRAMSLSTASLPDPAKTNTNA